MPIPCPVPPSISSPPLSTPMSSPPPDAPTNGAAKRQRRPSVRLGDIGEQPAAISHEPPRRSKQWKLHPSAAAAADPRPHFPPQSKNTPASRKRSPSPSPSPPPSPKDPSPDPVDETLASAVNRRKKPKKGGGGGGGSAAPAPAPASRRARSVWASKPVDAEEPKSSNGEDESDDSESHSDRRPTPAPAARVRVLAAAADVPAAADGEAPSEGGDWNNGSGRSRSPAERGVRAWLERLGLGRYLPVFEIHEVDEDVLQLLTMEDLKEMGINAVGSRRKLFSEIQKIGKGST